MRSGKGIPNTVCYTMCRKNLRKSFGREIISRYISIMKKTKFLLPIALVFCLCDAVCAQQIVEWNDLLTETSDARGTVYYRKSDREQLHGDFRIKRGLDEESIVFSCGMMDGEYRRYRDGILRESGVYIDGKRDGVFREYYQDGKTIQKETPMCEGKIEGVVKTYFRDGKPETEKEYHRSVEHGYSKRFDHETGETVLESHYVDGQKQGEEIIIENYGQNMRSTTVRHYKNGKLDGPYRLESSRDGKPYITETGAYAAGKKCGHWTQYDATTGMTREWEE